MDPKAFLGSVFADSYELLSIAGAGGMGTVFKARQIGLERIVAVKILDPEQLACSNSVARFMREARSICQLSHVHIAGFYSYGVFDELLPFIVMEWLEGRSLSRLIHKEAPLPAARVINIALQITDALVSAHKAGIVHRDLKPANIMLLTAPEPDFVKVVDFGLARLQDADSLDEQKLTKTGALLGTPQYLSPEQCRGQKADERSDIYALGCIVYEMLCAEPPFMAENAIAYLHMHGNDQVTPPSAKLQQKLPVAFEQTILKCLAKDPAHRFQNADELFQLLTLLAANPESSMVLKTALATPGKPFKKKGFPRKLFFIVLAAIPLICFLIFLNSPLAVAVQARTALKFDRSFSNIVYWQEQCEKLESQGKNQAADLVQIAVDNALALKSLDRKAALDLCLKLAAQFQKRGDRVSAARYAMEALRIAAETVRADQKNATAKVADSVDQAASIMIMSGQQISKEQLRMIMGLACKIAPVYEQGENTFLFELALGAAAYQKLPLSPDMLRLMQGIDIILARECKLDRLKLFLEKTKEAMQKYYARPGLELPYHLALVANRICLCGNSKELVLGLLAECNQRLESCPSRNDEIRGVAYRLMSEAVQRLDVSRALTCAEKAAAYLPLKDQNGLEAHCQLAHMLNLSERPLEAQKINSQVFSYVKDKGSVVEAVKAATVRIETLLLLGNEKEAKSLAKEYLERYRSVLWTFRLEIVKALKRYYEKKLDYDGYLFCLEEMLKIMPQENHGQVRVGIISIYLTRNDIRSAAEQMAAISASKKIDRAQLFADNFELLSVALHKFKSADESQAYKQALSICRSGYKKMLETETGATGTVSILADVVRCFKELGQRDEAKKLYLEVLEKLPLEKKSKFEGLCGYKLRLPKN